MIIFTDSMVPRGTCLKKENIVVAVKPQLSKIQK